MGHVIAADRVSRDVLQRVREQPCATRHYPDARWREPGEPCYEDPEADDLPRYERAARKGSITAGELADAVASADYVPPVLDIRPAPYPAIPPGSLGDSPRALMIEWPGWVVQGPEETGDGWEASCPAMTVGGKTPGALRLAIERAIGVS